MAPYPIWPYVAMVGETEPVPVGPIRNVRAHVWHHRPDLRVTVRHPQYPNQTYDTDGVEVRDGAVTVLFAMVELSNGVYGVFAPDP
jgi:hypothetical protein